ncbi:MAG: hypothetical protein KA803_07315 [Rhodoferax sp.]|nr:hypothetical protein [Rhodoferax sp.]
MIQSEKIGSAVGQKVKEEGEKINLLADEWESKSEEYLKNKQKDGRAIEKIAATKVLKSRS